MKAYFQKRDLIFKFPAGTSRGVLNSKPSWYIFFYDDNTPEKKGIGECSIIPGLSIDDENLIEVKLSEICTQINRGEYDFETKLYDFPSISFGIETALIDYESPKNQLLFPSAFTNGNKGIPINGLIWMGDFSSMHEQVKMKLNEGFKCIKIKIGAIDLEQELLLLKKLRKQFSASELELRVDANGAFSFNQAKEVLQKLAELEVHSIEQPIFQ